MTELTRNANESEEHFEFRTLLQEARPIVIGMFPDQKKKWAAEDTLAQEISDILANHPEYYQELGSEFAGIFPDPRGEGRAAAGH